MYVSVNLVNHIMVGWARKAQKEHVYPVSVLLPLEHALLEIDKTFSRLQTLSNSIQWDWYYLFFVVKQFLKS